MVHIVTGSSPRLRGTRGNYPRRSIHSRFIPAPAGNTFPDSSRYSFSAVHPRACGEHWHPPSQPRKSVGSSPRLRGTPGLPPSRASALRFIPAPAGNTAASALETASPPVHPRACGEHHTIHACWACISGSSPRLRGTHQGIKGRAEICRFIPAPAGNTIRLHHGAGAKAVHPRACGEHGITSTLRCLVVGSSPRLRGTPLSHFSFAVATRFIPAPAGNTRQRSDTHVSITVHPRACGEHSGAPILCAKARGSSPRLRGTQQPRNYRLAPNRFIPAPAGNTCIPCTRPAPNAVHPRACGEHIQHEDLGIGDAGSSPRLRGTRGFRGPHRLLQRFIPAPAGNTQRGPPDRIHYPVHPRACGEHGRSSAGLRRSNGSSPRLRGTRADSSRRRRSLRFIPAPAGNTSPIAKEKAASAVHPRACGEHVSSQGTIQEPRGSSPRLRGTQSARLSASRPARFIPAPAGNT